MLDSKSVDCYSESLLKVSDGMRNTSLETGRKVILVLCTSELRRKNTMISVQQFFSKREGSDVTSWCPTMGVA